MAPKSSVVLRFLAIVIVTSFIYPALYIKVVKNRKTVKNPQDSSSFGTYERERRNLLKSNGSLPRIAESHSALNCVKPSIDDFPSDLMTQSERQHGGVLAHIVTTLYMFGALAVVCDDYFVASLERICEGLKLKSDVAGATFMAAGSSAPEFFTSVIGVFITKGDIGLGTVVGSAVFNILFIVAICGLFAGCVLKLSWWPLMRDCIYYMLSIAALVIVTYDKTVYWYEALVLVIMYIIYVAIMYFNAKLENFFTGLFNDQETDKTTNKGDENKSLLENDYDNADDSSFKGSGVFEDSEGVSKEVDVVSFTSSDDTNSPFTMPQGFFKGILWIIFIPISCIFYITIPDCRKPRWKNWYFATFLLSVVWIAGLSYLLVWMVEIIGYTLEIPDVIMGLTFLAAGSSVPDGISSLLVARQGDGDMAVSNTVGSNVFDILLCLGFPWLLKTTAVELNSTVKVLSGSILYTSVSLFATVVVTILLISLNRWRLNKCLGAFFLFLYVAFISVATLFELNVFGGFNLPVCGA